MRPSTFTIVLQVDSSRRSPVPSKEGAPTTDDEPERSRPRGGADRRPSSGLGSARPQRRARDDDHQAGAPYEASLAGGVCGGNAEPRGPPPLAPAGSVRGDRGSLDPEA